MNNRYNLKQQAALLAVAVCTSLCFLTATAGAVAPGYYTSGYTPEDPYSGLIIPFWLSEATVELRFPSGDIAGAVSGNITKIYFKYAPWNTSSSTYTNLKIWIAQAPNSSLTNPNYYTPTQLCASYTTYTIPGGNASEWFSIPLQTPFAFDPSQALIVRICQEGSTGNDIGISYTTNAVSYYNVLYNALDPNVCSVTTPFDYASDLHPIFGIDVQTAAVPTLSEWGLYIMAALLLLFGSAYAFRRQSAAPVV